VSAPGKCATAPNSAEFNFCYFLAGVLAGASSLPSAHSGGRPTLAAMNNSLAQSNKSRTGDIATKAYEFEVEAIVVRPMRRDPRNGKPAAFD
jgi:hypothetical protein